MFSSDAHQNQEQREISYLSEISHHPITTGFPRMTAAEFNALVIDIKARGLQEPIVLFEGQVLDGRERLDACKAAHIDVAYVCFEGTLEAAKAYQISVNLIRGHFNQSQRAMATAMHFTSRNEANTGYETPHGNILDTSIAMGVQISSLHKAAKIKHRGSEQLVEEVLSGRCSLVVVEQRLGIESCDD
jgi:hypothetical protein